MKQLNVVIPLLIRSFHCKIYIYIYIHTHTYVATIAHYWKHINTLNSEIYFWFDFFSSYCHLCYNLEVSTHFQTYKIDSPVLSATLIPWVLVGKVNNTRHHERVRKCGTSLSDGLQPSPSGRSLSISLSEVRWQSYILFSFFSQLSQVQVSLVLKEGETSLPYKVAGLSVLYLL